MGAREEVNMSEESKPKETEEIFLIGFTGDKPHVPTSMEVRCARCQQPVWVSHGTINGLIESLKPEDFSRLQIICMKCMPEPITTENIHGALATQIEEMAKVDPRAVIEINKMKAAGLTGKEIAKIAFDRYKQQQQQQEGEEQQ